MQLRELFDELPSAKDAVIPLSLQQLMREPLDVTQDWTRAELLLLDAKKRLPDRPEILIALYKLYAYSNRFEESLRIIDEVLEYTAAQGGFDADWQKLQPDSAPWYPAQGDVRRYLYSLKATGFVCLRKGDLDGALAVLSKLLELDPMDQVGGSVVYEMAQSLVEE